MIALSYPVRFVAHQFATVEPGSRQAALEHVALVTSVEQGSLVSIAPDLGLPAFEFRSALPEDDVIAATIEDQVPGVTATVERSPSPEAGYAALRVQVEVDTDG
jgi:hypothetical protein